MPTTTRPRSRYFAWGWVLTKLTQPYVQKSTSTTLPRRFAILSGAELNQLLMPAKLGAVRCASATASGAARLRAVSPAMPAPGAPIRHSAIVEAEAASDRIVMRGAILWGFIGI